VVRQDFEIALCNRARHLRISRDGRNARDLPVLSRGHLQETAELPDVSGERLRHDFLLKIGPGVRPEELTGVRSDVCAREHSSRQSFREFNREADLGGGQREHVLDERPSGKEVDAAAPEFSRARSGKNELELLVLDQSVHFV